MDLDEATKTAFARFKHMDPDSERFEKKWQIIARNDSIKNAVLWFDEVKKMLISYVNDAEVGLDVIPTFTSFEEASKQMDEKRQREEPEERQRQEPEELQREKPEELQQGKEEWQHP